MIRTLLFVVLGYVAFVALMEVLIGFVQPEMEGGLRLTTTDSEGSDSSRNLASVEVDGKRYIASNHWLRGWYRQALAEPRVGVLMDGVEVDYLAVPIEGAERERVAAVYKMGFVLRFVCGFAPSRFLRLDPVDSGSA